MRVERVSSVVTFFEGKELLRMETKCLHFFFSLMPKNEDQVLALMLHYWERIKS